MLKNNNFSSAYYRTYMKNRVNFYPYHQEGAVHRHADVPVLSIPAHLAVSTPSVSIESPTDESRHFFTATPTLPMPSLL